MHKETDKTLEQNFQKEFKNPGATEQKQQN